MKKYSSLDTRTFASNQNRIYWGAFMNGADNYGPGYTDAPWDTNTWDLFESHTNKKTSIVVFGSWWSFCENGCGYKTFNYTLDMFNKIRSRGAIPLLNWMSVEKNIGSDDPNFSLSSIYNGKHDAFLKQYAHEAASWKDPKTGKKNPLFIRLDWEMNGDWFMWSEGRNGNVTGDYAKMWKHVWNVFNCIEDSSYKPDALCIPADNVNWIWSVNSEYGGSTPLEGLYPGNKYVDWTGIDGYNWAGSTPNETTKWHSFSSIMQPTYDHLMLLSPSKPIMVNETATVESNITSESKANWITNALTYDLPNTFPNIKAFVWFNWKINERGYYWPWYIESSTEAQTAFMNGINSSYYSTNEFANLDTTKIIPLNSLASPTNTPILSLCDTKIQAGMPLLGGDINCDDRVDILDLSTLASNWLNQVIKREYGDLNSDGKVDILDLSILATNWGKSS